MYTYCIYLHPFLPSILTVLSYIHEQVMLNVDGLSPHCFHSVNEFVQSALLAQSNKSISKSKKRVLPLLPVPRQTALHPKTTHTSTTTAASNATTSTTGGGATIHNSDCSNDGGSYVNSATSSIIESKVEEVDMRGNIEEEFEFV
jgi:hypothetical protein